MASANPEVFEEMKRLFLAWDARTLVPLYGSSQVVLDDGLERTGIVGGYRLRTSAAEPLFLSAPFRESQEMTTDWSYGFLLRACEQNNAANAELVYALGDSDGRGDLIRAVVDFGAGAIRLEEGKTSTTESVALAQLPTEFQAAALSFDSANNTLTFTLGEASVSLVLTGSYGTGLSHFAVGASAMEGELTTLRPGAIDYSQVSLSFLDLGPEQIGLQLNLAPADGPFNPAAESSTDLTSFATDCDVLVESLGGGRYQVTAERDAALEREFFRMRFDAP